MYEYFGVGPKIREEVTSIFPRFLHWLPKHRLFTPSRHSLEIWRLVIDNLIADDVSSSALFVGIFGTWLWLGLFSFWVPFVTFQMYLDPWARCKGYAKFERALELNGC